MNQCIWEKTQCPWEWSRSTGLSRSATKVRPHYLNTLCSPHAQDQMQLESTTGEARCHRRGIQQGHQGTLNFLLFQRQDKRIPPGFLFLPGFSFYKIVFVIFSPLQVTGLPTLLKPHSGQGATSIETRLLAGVAYTDWEALWAGLGWAGTPCLVTTAHFLVFLKKGLIIAALPSGCPGIHSLPATVTQGLEW